MEFHMTKLIFSLVAFFAAGTISVVNLRNANPKTPEIIRYIAINNLEAVQDALTRNPSLIRAIDIDGSTPLHVAAYRGYPEMVDLLISAGAEIDSLDKRGWTPLARAVLSGGGKQNRRLIVHALLAAGAKPDLQLPDGQTIKNLAESLHGPGSKVALMLQGRSANYDVRVATATE
jgi:ankyrin repeat protein